MAEDLNPLYKALNEAILKENDELTLKLSDQILQSTPADQEIFICKIVSLIRLAKYSEAYSLVNSKNIRSDLNLAYAFSYILYKLNKYNECLHQIKEFQNDPAVNHPGFLLLEAQILFKQGKYEDSSKLYLDLLKKFSTTKDYSDIIVNAIGAGGFAPEILQRRILEIGEDHTKKGDAMMEAYFNLSLIFSRLGKVLEAKNLLKRCINMIFDENGSNVESFDQQSFTDFVMTTLQLDAQDFKLFDLDAEECEKKINEYQNFIGKDLGEKNLRVILNNNIVALRSLTKNDNYTDSIKKLEEALIKDQKQTKSQLYDIKINRVLVNLMKGKLNEASKYLSDLENSDNKNELITNQNYIIAKAYLLYKSRKSKDLEGFLNSFDDKTMEDSFKKFLLLIRAELDRLSQDYKKTLERFNVLAKQQPNLFENEVFCGFIFSLASSNSELHAQSHEILRKIVANTYNPHILFAAAETSIKQRDYKQAAEVLNRVLKKYPDNLKAKYKLLYCLSYSDPTQLDSLITSLPKEKLISDIKEVKRLESDLSLAKDAKGGKGDQSPGLLSDKSKKIKKKKKRARLPKNFDPANPGPKPDPERWLPKYKRSKYKNLSKKKGLLRGPQGESTGKETVNTFKNSTAATESSKGKSKNKKRR